MVMATRRHEGFCKPGAVHTCMCLFHPAWLGFSILLMNIVAFVSTLLLCRVWLGHKGSIGNYVALPRGSTSPSSCFNHKCVLYSCSSELYALHSRCLFSNKVYTLNWFCVRMDAVPQVLIFAGLFPFYFSFWHKIKEVLCICFLQSQLIMKSVSYNQTCHSHFLPEYAFNQMIHLTLT